VTNLARYKFRKSLWPKFQRAGFRRKSPWRSIICFDVDSEKVLLYIYLSDTTKKAASLFFSPLDACRGRLEFAHVCTLASLTYAQSWRINLNKAVVCTHGVYLSLCRVKSPAQRFICASANSIYPFLHYSPDALARFATADSPLMNKAQVYYNLKKTGGVAGRRHYGRAH